ncbi:hypothetical protein E2986_12407 [Frieseomelitta varia]|uniref:Fibronectin type-III domain-containing protein n=1 Tax=Frieseomelitta varia TaxID=561572 RepID=A0A833VZK1_9HYME|nr:hypothetical protein E2986_12407 [Frieseomelitta varia]
MASWQYQMVDNSQLTTISDLTPHSIYTIRVQALTSVGPGPLSTPVQIKTQQGVPSQPEMLTAVDIGETKVTLQWNKPTHSAENILSYELYWNDTYAQEKHHRRIPVTENYTLTGLYPNTLYYVWLAARSQRGEGATTIPHPVRTKQYARSKRRGTRRCNRGSSWHDSSKRAAGNTNFYPRAQGLELSVSTEASNVSGIFCTTVHPFRPEFQEDITSRLSSPGVISQIDVSRIAGKRRRAIPASDPLVPINDPEFISRRTMAVQIARGPMERAIYAREGESESTGPWPS